MNETSFGWLNGWIDGSTDVRLDKQVRDEWTGGDGIGWDRMDAMDL